MEITTEYLDETYAVYERNREKYKDVLSKIRNIFDVACATKNVEVLKNYAEIYNDIETIRTAETYRLDIIGNILELETKHGAEHCFFEGCDTCDELFGHYIKCVLYIRRLEMQLSEELKSEALEYLLQNGVSSIAVLSILSNEQYEHKDLLSRILYEILSFDLSTALKLRDLDRYSTFMDEVTYKMNKALLFLEQGDKKSAQSWLMQISTPTEEITELICRLGE